MKPVVITGSQTAGLPDDSLHLGADSPPHTPVHRFRTGHKDDGIKEPLTRSSRAQTNYDSNVQERLSSNLLESPAEVAGGAKGKKCSVPLLSKGSLLSSAFTLASATLGAGTLALPSAMQQCGYVFGTVFLVVCGLFTLYTINLLVRVALDVECYSYEELARHLLGPRWEKFTIFSMVSFCWGITVVYVLFIGDIIKIVVKQCPSCFPSVFSPPNGYRWLTTLFWLCFMLPLSLLQQISALRFASFIGILSTFVVVTAIVMHSYEHSLPWSKIKPFNDDIGKLAAGLPIFMFSFCCQTNAFEIFAELRPRTVKKMTMSSSVTLITCTLVYVLTGVAGYLDFGDKVEPNILNSYDESTLKTPIMVAALISITITLTMAFPVCTFPARDAICHALGYTDILQTPTFTRMAICTVLSLASLLLGLFAGKKGLNSLFGILGGACGSVLSYILPALFAIKSRVWTPATVGWFDYVMTYTVLVFGVVAGLLGTVMSVEESF